MRDTKEMLTKSVTYRRNQICRSCSEVKMKIRAKEKAPGKKQYAYTDEDGKRWYGNMCHPCGLEDHKKRILENFTDTEPVTMSHRKCRGCQAQLPLTRYFECETCKPVLRSDMGDAYLY